MSLLRVDIRINIVEPGWLVTLEVGGQRLAEHRMTRLPGETSAPAGAGLTGLSLKMHLQAIADRQCSHQQAVALGRYLYGALLEPVWDAVEGTFTPKLSRLEFALNLEGARELAHLPWELMYGTGGYLARGLDSPTGVVEVAITRRCRRAAIGGRPLRHPIRYLSLIGTSVDDSIRAGAEVLGLLRQLGRQVQERIVQKPLLNEIGSIIETFRPDIVHVISHGEVDAETGTAVLRFYDDITGGFTSVDAETLAAKLVRDGMAPAIVLLSACASGALLAARSCEPLATGLVRAGVPMVVAMAGEISDLACRLFARSFGEALMERGSPLWAATAARRAALRSTALPSDAVDWAMIDVFLGEDVASDVAVAPADDNPEADLVERWLKRPDVDLKPTFGRELTVPPFCGRLEIIEAFYDLMLGREQPVLAIVANPPINDPLGRLGKLRTLTELASIATRAGHVVVPFLPYERQTQGFPTNKAELLVRLLGTVQRTRDVYGLPERSAKLAAAIDAKHDDYGLSVALADDLISLGDDARKRHPFIDAAKGRVIVFLNNIHAYQTGTTFLLHDLISNVGLGKGNVTIPVVMTFKTGGVHDDTWRDVTEGDKRRSSLRVLDLRPFGAGEDLLAYQRILLQPHRRTPDLARKRWFFEIRPSPALSKVQRIFHAGTGGYPGKIWGDGFAAAVEAAMPGIVREASDDDLLAALRLGAR